ncbi:MAG: LPXTG cell wall anchor domain-containing protein [Rhodoglobus sp.]
MRYQPIAATALALVLVGAGAISASAVDWDGGGGAATGWSTNTNWSTDAAIPANSALNFATGGTTSAFDLGAGFLVGSLTFGAPNPFSITAQTPGVGFALTGDLTTTALGQSYYLDVPVNVTPATSTWNIGGTDQLNVTEPVTINPGSTVDFLVQTNALLSVATGSPVNGGTATKSGGGTLFFLGGGTLGGMTIANGVVFSGSVMSDMDVVGNGGYLSGGALSNTLCNQQQVGGVNLVSGIISPGAGSVYGDDTGYMCLSGSFDGNANSLYEAEVDGTTSDTIASKGTFDANSTILHVITLTAPAVGTVLTIAKATDIGPSLFTDPINNDPIADNSVFVQDGQYYSIDYRTTDIVLTYLGTTPPAPPAGPALAATGTDSGAITALAGFLLLGGIGAIMVATRRRHA